MAGARAGARCADSALLAPAAAAPVCRAGRPLPRNLLLGFLFHDARPRGKRPPRSRDRHGEELRFPHRPIWPRAQWQSNVLPEPLAASLLCRHGRADRSARRQPGIPAIPARAAARIRVLDGWRIKARARCGVPACGQPAGWIDPQPVLGRPRHRARGVLSGRCRDRGKIRPPAGRGVPEPARGSRKRMGLQLSLARRWTDARHDPHGRHRSRRSQLPPVSARADARARLPRQRTTGRGLAIRRARNGPATSHPPVSLESAGGRVRGLRLAGTAPHGTTERGDPIPTVHRHRHEFASCGRRECHRATIAPAGWPRRDDRPDRRAMGRAERLGASAMDRDRRPQSLWAQEACRQDRAALDPGEHRSLRIHRQARRKVRRQRRRCRSGRGIPATGRLRLDQRGIAPAAGALSVRGN